MVRSPRRTLSPHGTARRQFEELRGREISGDDLAGFFRALGRAARAHDLGDDSLYLAEEVVRLASFLGEVERRALALALLSSMIAVRQGCTRLPLDGKANGHLGRIVGALLREADVDVSVASMVKEISRLARDATFDRMIGGADEDRPLVVQGDYLYQHRLLAIEDAFVHRLRQRVRAAVIEPPALLPAAVDQVVASAAFPLSDEQRAAVHGALSRRLTVITGGPGTGKTAIILSILRVAFRLGFTGDSVALAAPTGKAVNRMSGAIRAGLNALVPAPGEQSDADDELRQAGPEPRTIHRLLGYLPQTRDFRHHDNHPLRARLVIVDEASMIDLALMERLLAALPGDAHLVLLGDADQLPSVDAGAVLRDLVHALPEQTCRLTHSYRMDPADPAGRQILTAARRVNAGEPPWPAAPGADGDAVTLFDTGSQAARVGVFLDQWFAETIADDSELAELAGRVYRARNGIVVDDHVEPVAAVMRRYQSRRLLTATRRHSTGADNINRQLHSRALALSSVDHAPDFLPGEPIMARSNDYDRGLFNGDQGVILRVADDGDDRHHYRAIFPTADGFRVFHLDAVRSQIQLAYAMTVHKSQGSEFDQIALILPTRDLPLLTRELLYTAITRARRSVTLVGSAPLVRITANRSTIRLTGTADKLAGDR